MMDDSKRQSGSALSWRDRLQLVNSVLFCLVGGLVIVRSLRRDLSPTLVLLGIVFLVFGAYRLALARREWRKRKENHEQ